MNINQLEVFIKVAEKMNVTEAAKALFISQPAVSKALKNLESFLQIKLFIRDKQNGLALTDVGQEMLILAREMKELESKMLQLACQENKLLRGKVRIGSFPAASANLLPDAIGLFRTQYPQVTIELMEGTSNQIKQWVDDRSVEIGIVASPFEPFDFKIVAHDSMAAILPENHPLQLEREVSLEDYRNELIFCKGGHEAVVLNTLEEKGIPFHENLTVQTAETLIHMVQKHLGIGIISRFSLSSVTHHLMIKEIVPRITRDIGLVANSFTELTPAGKQFLNIMGQLYGAVLPQDFEFRT
ncbi:LysR family transcriptional regulator [Paenibacillus sp. S150]|uniref:LysR family transcriptional regulator n=1 Tax=Paenibacillus sp. S150 TaxID=2749826 RepID=UPI001C563FA1|nr:LysR family transcriptional regulator [Paenibacillus sp. S150]MBW4080538.1 LysR family transcriptional regulator [Paenibacillus sp. S150]